jgi:RNA polymerase sigma factor (sigma-70 family)
MTARESSRADLNALAHTAARGDRAAAQAVLDAVQDDVYRLALRMLGHQADAEDATQEILLIVLTHLGSFRGESALMTWVWKIAAQHLVRVRRGRRETLTFETLDERLRAGLREDADSSDPEMDALAGELRLRCTEAMLLSLERELRLAYILGDLLNLSGEDAAAVLDVPPATYRKRLSRARALLYQFIRNWCGVFAPDNPCRCQGQVACAVERGLLNPHDLDLSHHPARPSPATLNRATREVTGLLRVAEVLRDHPDYLAPASVVERVRALVDSTRLEVLTR